MYVEPSRVTTPTRRREGAPGVLASAGAVALGLVAGTALGGLLALATMLAVSAWVAMRIHEARRPDTDRVAWVLFGRAVPCVALGFGLELAVHVAVVRGAVPQGWVGVAFTLGAVSAWSALYRGLVRWNRVTTVVSDPSDWLNGVSAVMALMALGNLVLTVLGSPLAQLPWWLLQGWLLQVSALAVLLGTTGTVAALAGLGRDTRAQAIAVALGLGLCAQVAGAIVGPLDVVELGARSLPLLALATAGSWMLLTVTVCVTSFQQGPGTAPREATPGSTTAGAVVVVLSSIAIMAVHGLIADEPFAVAPGLAAAAAAIGAIRMLRQVRDLSEVARSRAEARTDDLTGVANRRRLVEIVTAAARDSIAITLLVIDLDRFKEMNDRHGHTFGDELIRTMAQRLQGVVAGRGTFARLGGDEFALVMEGRTTNDGVEIATEVLTAIREPIEVDGRFVRIDASIGIASTALSGHGDGDALRSADAAMYVAKRNGGGLSVYDEAADARARAERRLTEELRGVLARNPAGDGSGIVMHFQPQLDLASGLVVGIEALVRWRQPRLGLLPPATFLHLAEENGLMGLLTSRVMELSAREATVWRAHGHDVRLSFNLSTSSLTDPALVGALEEVLARNGLPPDRLVVEITETSLMQDPALAVAVTRDIAARGIGVSIDDYGTGYSSLAYLNDLPAEELKLDRAFTARLTSDPRTAAIVSGTVDLARHLGLRLVAEGVEDEDTLAALRALGCDVTQGYLHTRPLPAAQLHSWLDRHVTGQG